MIRVNYISAACHCSGGTRDGPKATHNPISQTKAPSNKNSIKLPGRQTTANVTRELSYTPNLQLILSEKLSNTAFNTFDFLFFLFTTTTP